VNNQDVDNEKLTEKYKPTGGVFVLSCTTRIYEGWNFNSGNYLFTTDTK